MAEPLVAPQGQEEAGTLPGPRGRAPAPDSSQDLPQERQGCSQTSQLSQGVGQPPQPVRSGEPRLPGLPREQAPPASTNARRARLQKQRTAAVAVWAAGTELWSCRRDQWAWLCAQGVSKCVQA